MFHVTCGAEYPHTSRPTRLPWEVKARVRFTAAVELPTPAIPEAAASKSLTLGAERWPTAVKLDTKLPRSLQLGDPVHPVADPRCRRWPNHIHGRDACKDVREVPLAVRTAVVPWRGRASGHEEPRWQQPRVPSGAIPLPSRETTRCGFPARERMISPVDVYGIAPPSTYPHCD
jgi:hypothetical protein